jgi:acyl-CoA synthetase (AMP-forming)/AMP-acid ligase II
VRPARHWREIPAVPTAAFKRAAVRAFPASRTLTHFRTSGTTERESGRHYFETLAVYEAAIVPNFRRHLLPDGRRMRMMILTPPPSEASHSSLVHMMEVVRRRFGTRGSRYFLREAKLLFPEIRRALTAAIAAREPVLLAGTAFAFAFLLDWLRERDLRFGLPAGSRIMETGGFKGRAAEIPRTEFYQQLTDAFGVLESHIVNEYGMTELSSQFYDTPLLGKGAGGAEPRIKAVPPWTRILVVNPLTGEEVSAGERGVIRIYDLANVGSVLSIQTEDAGVRHGSGFEVLGRVATAPLRGCSLGAEDILRRVD